MAESVETIRMISRTVTADLITEYMTRLVARGERSVKSNRFEQGDPSDFLLFVSGIARKCFRALTVMAIGLACSPTLATAVFKLQKRELYSTLGRFLARVLASCGGALPKFGQILSTRPDLLPMALCAELSMLQDRMPPLAPSAVNRLLQAETANRSITQLQLHPEASGTIAQVHRAQLFATHSEIALKLKRPHIGMRIDLDCELAEAMCPLLQKFQSFRSIPMREAVQGACIALRQQTDFRREARNLDRLRKDFLNYPDVVIPEVHWELSSENVICMTYVKGLKKIIDPAIPHHQACQLVTLGLHCLYRMIFETGFLHCDLHPGNLMVNEDGRLVILDAGLMVELDEFTRHSFAEFFAAIALRKGSTAAKIVRSTAVVVPTDLDVKRFDAEISELIERTGGMSAQNFQVTAFVSELFVIQARHGMRGTSRFSLIILAMLVYEGTVKQRFSGLDFQKEAIPFVLDAILTKSTVV
jgi:ubiquinone biosynthesis protein